MEYTLYTTDTSKTLSGGDLANGEWFDFEGKSSRDSRKPASYAVWQAMDDAMIVAGTMINEQGIVVTKYKGCDRPIVDDGRLAAAVAKIREAVASRAAKLAGQTAAQFPCAEAKDGCHNRVQVRGSFCPRCRHDED